MARNFRLEALRRFAAAITVFNVLGHFWFGFEQSWAHPLVALAAAYGMELLLEVVEAWSERRAPRFLGGGPVGFVDFLLPAHISGLAVAMLIYSNATLAPVAFAAGVAIASKYVLRVSVGKGRRHYLNPSNWGISVTLILFPWVGIAPPYMFTENLLGIGDWILPLFMICTGSMLNARYTRKIPLILAWLGGFFVQGVVRSAWFDTPMASALLPMTGVAFILFTFYMVSDPATTPRSVRGQVLFGAGVAAVYGLLMAAHIVFGLFFALSVVCLARGGAMAWSARAERRREAVPGVPAVGPRPVPAGAAPAGALALENEGSPEPVARSFDGGDLAATGQRREAAR